MSLVATDSLTDIHNRIASERGLQNTSAYYKNFKTYFEMSALLQTHWIFQSAVTLEPFHMVRKFRQIKKAPEGYENKVNEFNIKKLFYSGSKLAKTFGGAIAVMTIDDGLDPELPLDIDKIRKDGLKDIKLYEKPLLSVYNEKGFSTTFSNDYTHYKINTDNPLKIHRSRCLEFVGDDTLSSYSSMQTDFLGNSVIYKLYDVLIADSSINDIFANLPIRLNQPVLRTKLGRLETAEQQEAVYNRLNVLAVGLSLHKMLVIDKDHEEIGTVTLDSASITSLDESISKKASKVLRIPELVLLGNNPTGLSANGESGLTLFYDKVEAMQIDEFETPINKLDTVIAKAFFNSTEKIEYEWIALYHKSNKSLAETEQIHINNANVLSMMYSDTIVTKYLKKKGVFDEELEQLALKEAGILEDYNE